MSYLGRRTSAYAIALSFPCILAACHPTTTSGKDASPTEPASDASSAVAGSDASPIVVGGDASGGIEASPPLTVDNFPTAFTNVTCDALAACCRQYGLDSSSCHATLEAAIGPWMSRHASDPKLAFDPDAAARCIDLTRAGFLACNDRNVENQSDSACEQMFRGTVPIGGSCTDGHQCVPLTASRVECTGGVCIVGTPPASLHGAVGDACRGTCRQTSCTESTTSTANADCYTQEGVYCSNGVCVATPEIGQPCISYCGKDAHCTDAGLCTSNLATGPCTCDQDCLAPSYCDDSTWPWSCTAPKENGAACSLDYQCIGGQCLDSTCRDWSMASSYTCSGMVL